MWKLFFAIALCLGLVGCHHHHGGSKPDRYDQHERYEYGKHNPPRHSMDKTYSDSDRRYRSSRSQYHDGRHY
ncbi:MAG: hypothetical protein PUB69_02940 [Desulfovibrionaceae bacterium]|nr:hypothetical protein [Desulfovibrionaceae bacterium]